jgi:hypothetical protein
MRPALSWIFTSNELIKRCFLRCHAERLSPTLGRHEKHSPGFSLNPAFFESAHRCLSSKEISSGVQNFSNSSGRPATALIFLGRWI